MSANTDDERKFMLRRDIFNYVNLSIRDMSEIKRIYKGRSDFRSLNVEGSGAYNDYLYFYCRLNIIIRDLRYSRDNDWCSYD